jgi:hypothetical protein
MATIDTNKLKNLIDHQHWTEAQQLLEDFFHASMTEDNGGAGILEQTSAYLEAKNSLSKQHLEILDNAIAMLKQINAEQKAEEDRLDLEATRSQIKS